MLSSPRAGLVTHNCGGSWDSLHAAQAEGLDVLPTVDEARSAS